MEKIYIIYRPPNLSCKIFFFIFLSRIVKLIHGLCLLKNLNHICETKGLRSNIKILPNTGVIRNHQIITSTEAQKIMKSGRLIFFFFWGGGGGVGQLLCRPIINIVCEDIEFNPKL